MKGDPPLNGIVSVTPQRRSSQLTNQSPPSLTVVQGTQVDKWMKGRHASTTDEEEQTGAGAGAFTPQNHEAAPSHCFKTDGGHIDKEQRGDMVEKCDKTPTYGNLIVLDDKCVLSHRCL